MPTCSDKPNVANRDTPGRCFKKGLGAGFGAGVRKGKEIGRKAGLKRGKKIGKVSKILERKKKFSRSGLMRMGKGELEAQGRRFGVKGGRNKTKAQITEEILLNQRGGQ